MPTPSASAPSSAPSSAGDRLAAAARHLAERRLDEARALCQSVLDTEPGHPEAQRQLGLILAASREFPAAAAVLATALPAFPRDPVIRLVLAEALWGAGDPVAAVPHFRAGLALGPDQPAARLRLGELLLAAGRPDEARAELGPVAAALPDNAAAALHLGRALLALGHIDAAIDAFRDAARRDPDNAGSRIALAHALAAGGDAEGAIAELEAAVHMAPGWSVGWATLANLLDRAGRKAEAVPHYRTALRLANPAIPEVPALLANALFALGETEEARRCYQLSMAGARWASSVPSAARGIRIGVLSVPGEANTPIEFLLDRARADVEVLYLLDGVAYPAERIAGAYDVLFNAVGDPDCGAAGLRQAIALADAVGLPVINDPRLILDTGRDRMAERLGGIAGCTVPRTGRYAIADLRTDAGLNAAIEAVGLPALARPVGDHGGMALALVSTAAELRGFVEAAAGEAVYLTRFHDVRSADGRFRKLRFIVVDGQVLPYHLAIGDAWLVHYFRTGMRHDPALLREEQDFLDDPASYVGPVAMAALAEIARRVPLDFFGLDAAIAPDATLLLFECNATMAVTHVDQPAVLAYKRAPAERLRAAVAAMIARRARADR